MDEETLEILAGLNAAQNAIKSGIDRIESERRIEFLAKGYGEVASLQNAATKAAKDLVQVKHLLTKL